MNRSLWRAGLLAGLIVALAASSARAGFVFQLNSVANGSPGAGFRIVEQPNGSFQVLAPSGGGSLVAPTTFTANDSVISGTATIDGVNFTFRATSNEDAPPTTASVVTATIKGVNGSDSKEPFAYFVADSPFPGSPQFSVLQATTHSFADHTPGVLAASSANIGGVAHTGPTPYVTGPNQTTQTAPLVVSTGGQPYSLSNVGGIVNLLPGGTAHFESIGSYSMPEPTGVLLGLLGLPCMGGLVGWVRRRRAEAAA